MRQNLTARVEHAKCEGTAQIKGLLGYEEGSCARNVGYCHRRAGHGGVSRLANVCGQYVLAWRCHINALVAVVASGPAHILDGSQFKALTSI